MGIRETVETLILETKETGGSTVSFTGQKVPDTGYMVGGIVNSLYFDAHLIIDLNHMATVTARIIEWLGSHGENIVAVDDVFVGGWIDTEENIAYIDVSIWWDDMEQALLAAKINNEIAIWDLGKSAEIRV